MNLVSRRRAPVFGYAVAAVFGLAACSTEVPYDKPGFNFAGTYSQADRGAPVLLTNSDWWKGLGDPTLDRLVTRALSGSIDLAIARERVAEAMANLESVPPSGSVTPSASIQRRKEAGGTPETRSEGTLGLSWLLDPYGARRQQIRAAGARVDAADAELDAARLLLIGNIANAYVDLRYYQRVLHLRRQQLQSRRQTATLTQRLFDQGSATRLDNVRTQALVSETQAQLPGLVAAVRARKNEIAVLAGAAPGALGIDLDSGMRQPRPEMSPEIGIPADLVRNRPDIRIAERLYYASVAEIGVARADLYPRLSLGGSIGRVSVSGSSATEYFFGPSVELPAIPSGSRRATVAARYSQARQAHGSWKSTVLNALREVEDAIAEYSASTNSVQSAHRSARLYREARDLTRDLVERGGTTVRELINAEEDIADADAVLAENLRQLGLNYIRLNVSLGAGSADPSSPPQSADVLASESVTSG